MLCWKSVYCTDSWGDEEGKDSGPASEVCEDVFEGAICAE